MTQKTTNNQSTTINSSSLPLPLLLATAFAISIFSSTSGAQTVHNPCSDSSLDQRTARYLEETGYTNQCSMLHDRFRIRVEPRVGSGLLGQLGQVQSYQAYFVDENGNVQSTDAYFRELKKQSRSQEVFLSEIERRLEAINQFIKVSNEIIRDHRGPRQTSTEILKNYFIFNLKSQVKTLKDFRQEAFAEYFAETIGPVIDKQKKALFKSLIKAAEVKGCGLSNGQYNVDLPQTWGIHCDHINSVDSKQKAAQRLRTLIQLADSIKANLLIVKQQKLQDVQIEYPDLDFIRKQWKGELRRVDKSELKLSFFNYNLKHRIENISGIKVNCEAPLSPEGKKPSELRCYHSLARISRILENPKYSSVAERIRKKAFQSINIVHDKANIRAWDSKHLNGNQIDIKSSWSTEDLLAWLLKQPDENSEIVQIRREREASTERHKSEINKALRDSVQLTGCDSKVLDVQSCLYAMRDLAQELKSKNPSLESFIESLNELSDLDEPLNVELVLSRGDITNRTPVFREKTKILLDVESLKSSDYWWNISAYGSILQGLSTALTTMERFLESKIELSLSCDVDQRISAEAFLCRQGFEALVYIFQQSSLPELELLIARINSSIKALEIGSRKGTFQKNMVLGEKEDRDAYDHTLYIDLRPNFLRRLTRGEKHWQDSNNKTAVQKLAEKLEWDFGMF